MIATRPELAPVFAVITTVVKYVPRKRANVLAYVKQSF